MVYLHGMNGTIQNGGVNAVLLGLTVLEVLLGNLGEQSVGQNVLVALGVLTALLTVLIQLVADQVGGAAGDDLLIAQSLLAHFLIDGSGQTAVLAAQQTASSRPEPQGQRLIGKLLRLV